MRYSDTQTLSDYLRVLKARRLLVLAVTLFAALAAFGLSQLRTTTYEATATLDFQDPAEQTNQVLGGGSSNFFPQNAATEGAEVVTRTDIVIAVAKAQNYQGTINSLRKKVDTKVVTNSNLVQLTVKAGTAKASADLANEFAKQAQLAERQAASDFFSKRAKDLPEGKQGRAVAKRLLTLAAVAEPVNIVRSAEVPNSPASPKPLRDTILAAFLGLLLGIGAAFVRNSLDRRVTDSHDIQRDLGMPLVGYVRDEILGMVGFSEDGENVSEDDLEIFRILRANVDFLVGDEPLGMVAVTSALPEEGKSTVASWFAYANAVAGRRTLLIECDFRRPVLAKRIGFAAEPGLSDFLTGKAEPSDILRVLPIEGENAEPLVVIPAGVNTFRPAELIASQPFRDFLAEVSHAYEMVVIDVTPLLPVGDALELIPQVDGVLLCVRLGQTTIQQATAAKEAMQHLPDRPTALVMTGLKGGSSDDYYGYYSSHEAVASTTPS